MRLRFLLATTALVAVSTGPARAVVNVSDETGLRNAIFAANTGGDTAINFTGNITLSQSLPMITSNIAVIGNGFTLDAANTGRAIFVASGSVNVSSLTIANALARGGNGAGGASGGGSTGGGGGGGLGAGAAVFVGTGASLTLRLVQVQSAAATGGAGGDGGIGPNGAGGGGLGGNGGVVGSGASGGGGGYAGVGGGSIDSAGGGGGGEFGRGGEVTASVAGGGGGGGQRGNGGNATFLLGGGGGGGGAAAGSNGGDATSTTGGAAGAPESGAGGTAAPTGPGGPAVAAGGGGGGGSNGGAGGAGAASGGGGGAGVQGGAGGAGGRGGGGGGGSSGPGGAGGAFGGGGGTVGINLTAGAGGYGGGGGGAPTDAHNGTGGAGGFGGGGGGGVTPGAGGTFGGAGGGGGGGGAALGGAVFVATGGTLTIVDGGFAGTYTLTAGAGGTGAGNGQAQGRVMFLHGTGAINFSLSNGTAVTIAGDDAIAGTGALALGGAGTLAIAGANPNYSGTTTVNGGRLAVNGTLPGAVVVNAGGILGGTGSLGATTINAGGTLAPGNSIGTITLASVTFNAGSIYVVEVGPSAADRTNVTGAATLAGTVQATFQAGSSVPRSYTILSAAGGRSGTFNALTTINLPSFFTAGLSYTSTDVLLNLTARLSSLSGLNGNQGQVAGALDAGFNAGGALTGGLAGLLGLTSSQVPGALTSLSGEIGTGPQSPSFAMGGAFFNAIASQMQSWRSGSSGAAQGNAAYRVELASAQPMHELTGFAVAQAVPGGGAWPPPAVGRRFSAWASGFGLSGSRDGDAGTGSAALSYSMGGGAAGFDAQLTPSLLVGASVAGAGSSFSLSGQPSSGTARTVFFGLYGSWTMGPLYVDAAAGYGHGQFTTTRAITVGATSELAEGDFDGHQYGGRIEAGWRFDVARYRLTPFAGVAVQALHQNPYSETTRNTATNLPGTMGLSYAGETTTSVRSFLGAQATTTFVLGERTTLTPRVRLAWAHEFNHDRQVNASFLTLPAAAFTVSGARPARDAAIVSAGADLALGRNVALYAQFDGDIAGGGGNAYAGSGGIRISW